MNLYKTSKQQELTDLQNSINDLIKHANAIAEDAQLSFDINIPNYGIHTVDWTSSWSDSYD